MCPTSRSTKLCHKKAQEKPFHGAVPELADSIVSSFHLSVTHAIQEKPFRGDVPELADSIVSSFYLANPQEHQLCHNATQHEQSHSIGTTNDIIKPALSLH